jgi:hypothetical protein
MTLVLDIPSKPQSRLSSQALKAGIPLERYVVRVLSDAGVRSAKTGKALVAYWKSEGLIGKRRDITNGPAHARTLRKRAEKRLRG